MKPVLYLVPAPLGGAAADALSATAAATVRSLRDFAVENAKSARAFLGGLGMPCAIRDLSIREIAGDASALLAPLREGRPLGVLSEAGCPAVADPGAALVAAAHAEGFRVIPLVGPSAVLLALMALLETCDAATRLCVAVDPTLPTEEIATRDVAQWRRLQASIGRRPAVFLLQA